MMSNMSIRLFLFVAYCCLSNFAKSTDIASTLASDGKLINYELVDNVSKDRIDSIRTNVLQYFLAGSTAPYSNYAGKLEKPDNSVKLYKVTYTTHIPELSNKVVKATGLIAIPSVVSSDRLPLISYQHGTVFDKRMVPSVPSMSMETQFMIAQFAAKGYILIAADYIGLGDNSTETNTYFVRYSTEQACLDLYKASLSILKKENINKGNFFVNGWSQGGYNAMAFLRRLENEKISVTAAFTAAAPVDPLFFVTRGALNTRPFDAAFTAAALCNLLFCNEKYNKIPGLSRKYISPEYYQIANDFSNFKMSYPEFITKVPTDLKKVFTAAFFEDAKLADAPLWKLLSSFEAYRWFSAVPLRAYYGMHDEAVPDYIASLAVQYMTLIGKKDAVAINVGELADHRATYIQSLIDAKPWIDSFNK